MSSESSESSESAPSLKKAHSLALELPPQALSDTHTSVALLPPQVIEVGESLITELIATLLREIEQDDKMLAVSPNDVLADLVNAGLTAECHWVLLCVAKAARQARAHMGIEWRVASIGGTTNVSARLVSATKGTEIRRAALPLSDNPTERAVQLHKLVQQLFYPELYVGALQIELPQADADIYIDDHLVGTTPLNAPIANLYAGPHILRVSKPGFASIYRFVDVVYKRTATVSLDLKDNTISGLVVERASDLGFGRLFVSTSLAGVDIRLDGEPIAQTPLTAPLEKIPAGNHTLKFEIKGKEVFVKEFKIVANKRLDLVLGDQQGHLVAGIIGVNETKSALPNKAITDLTWASVAGSFYPSTIKKPSKHNYLRWDSGRFMSGFVIGTLGGMSLLASSYYGNITRRANNDADSLYNSLNGKVGLDSNGQCRLRIDINDPDGTLLAQCDELHRLDTLGPKAQKMQYITLVGGTLLGAIGGALIVWDLADILFGDQDSTQEVTPKGAATNTQSALNLRPYGAIGRGAYLSWRVSF